MRQLFSSPPGFCILCVAVAVSTASFAFPGAALGADPELYRVPRERFRSTVTTIALQPIRVPPEVPDPARIRGLLEPLLDRALREKGYEVVASRDFEAVWRPLSQQIGGVFDPISGKVDEARHEAVRDLAGRELSNQLGVNALLQASIYEDLMDSWSRLAFFRAAGNQLVLWHGMPLLAQPTKVRGAVLGIAIADLAGVELYSAKTGLEWTEVIYRQSHEVVPPERRFLDRRRHRRAVEADLDALEPRGGPALAKGTAPAR